MSQNPRRPIWLNIAFVVVLPLIVLPASAVYLWNHGLTLWELATALVLWVITGMGITSGYHRLFSHRSYTTRWPVRAFFAIAGAMAGQNSIIAWSSDHRRHHTFTDTERDPYNAKQGLWWSHMGWILVEGANGDKYDDVPDLWADPIVAFQHKYWLAIAALGNLAILVPVGLYSERMGGVLLLAGALRLIIVQHFTFTINSLSHWWGKQPWSTKTTSRDNRILAMFTFGEGYHNFHHTFQADYRNGIAWYDFDPGKWLIRTLASVGLADNLRKTPEHTLLRARYEQTKRSLEARLSGVTTGAEARVDALREEFAAARRDAEAKLESALAALRARTQAWTEARRELADRAHEAADRAQAEYHAKMQEFEEAIREASYTARVQLRAWERAARRELAAV